MLFDVRLCENNYWKIKNYSKIILCIRIVLLQLVDMITNIIPLVMNDAFI